METIPMKTTTLKACALATCLVAGLYRAISPPEIKAGNSWDQKAAAAYLEKRAGWWITWPVAGRDHETFCISCHTAVPYALANGPSFGARGRSPFPQRAQTPRQCHKARAA